MKTTLAAFAGIMIGVSGMKLIETNIMSSPKDSPHEPTPPQAINFEKEEISALVGNLLACRKEKATKICIKVDQKWSVSANDIRSCEEARRGILGDGIFDHLKAKREDPAAQRLIATLAWNLCRLPSDDPQIEGIQDILQRTINEKHSIKDYQ